MKWLMTVIVVLASMALVLTFFTAEGTHVNIERFIGDINGYYKVSAGKDGMLSTLPPRFSMPASAALPYAMEAIHDTFDADISDPYSYTVHIDFYEGGSDLRFASSCWYFILINRETDENYDVFIRAVDGKVLDISGPGHG